MFDATRMCLVSCAHPWRTETRSSVSDTRLEGIYKPQKQFGSPLMAFTPNQCWWRLGGNWLSYPLDGHWQKKRVALCCRWWLRGREKKRGFLFARYRLVFRVLIVVLLLAVSDFCVFISSNHFCIVPGSESKDRMHTISLWGFSYRKKCQQAFAAYKSRWDIIDRSRGQNVQLR